MGVSKRAETPVTKETMDTETTKELSPSSVSPYLQVARLPRIEAWLNIMTWSGFAAYFCYNVYWVSQEYVHKRRSRYLVPGYSFLGRIRDDTNGEWVFMRGWCVLIWPWLSIHILLSLVTRLVAFEHRFYILSLYCAAVLTYMLGYMVVLFIALQCLVMYLVTTVFRSVLVVWAVSAGFHYLNHNDAHTYLMESTQLNTNRTTQYLLFLYGLALSNVHYISFCLERCKHLEGSEGKGEEATGRGFSFIDMLVYIFYLPIFFSGPLMTYDEFLRQKTLPQQPWTKLKTVNIVKDSLRIVFWTLFIEVILHYFYFSALMNDPEVMNRLPRWALVGVGYCCGQFIMVKYVVIYGLPIVLAEFDQIQWVQRPKCISRIYLYSEMWKKFDVGLYRYIKRHIYVPMGGSRHGFPRQMVSSFMCFVFIFVWHGSEYYVFIWTVLNYIGILLESIAARVSDMPRVKAFERGLLSRANSRRVRAFVTIPSFAMSILAIFIFFGADEIGTVYFNRVACYGPGLLSVIVVLYTYIQSSIEVAIFEAEKVKQN